jgi:Cu-Zn family superoxide dismutase
MSAKYPGTDVEIDATGVTFPVKALSEIGEAGKSCDGSTTSSGVCGSVHFTQTDAETITIEYEIRGLQPGKQHGFHIHEKADFSNGCASAGPHYNPFGKTHGGPDDEVRHVGDLGNVETDADGVAKGKITDKSIKLFGEYTVVGRSMMVHADGDDLGKGPLEGWPETPPPPAPAQHTKTTGNAGARIGCGVIVDAK